jgi:uncharacterized protein (TIGR02246 family)
MSRSRPTLTHPPLLPTGHAAVTQLISTLQAGWDASSADTFDHHFAADIAWGSPYGQTISGFENLYQIHSSIMGRGALPASRYEVVNVLAPMEGVVVAHVRRQALYSAERNDGEVKDGGETKREGSFSEMAMYVLVERDGEWWVAAGQNTVVGKPPRR